MASEEAQLEVGLREIGEKLLRPSGDVGEVLQLLDQAESLLAKVEQSPPQTMSAALQPVMRALVSKDLFGHAEMDVKVAVASCVSEITRITAPEAPYDDEKMKGVFEMIVEAFRGLDDISGRSFSKRVSVLETVAKVRLCVVMLDLECDDLILQMFEHFLHTIRDEHSENVFSLMEMIMRVVIEESEEVQPNLIHCLLSSVKKDNKDVLPIARKLGEEVISSSREKLKQYILEAIKSVGTTLSDYSGIVASTCTGDSTAFDETELNTSGQSSEDDSKQSERTVSEELPQESDKMDTEGPCSEVGTLGDKSPKSAVSNGNASASSELQAEKPEISKSPDIVKSVPSNKVVKKSKFQKKNSSLVSTDATDDLPIGDEKAAAKTSKNAASVSTPDQARPKRGRPPKTSMKRSPTDPPPASGRRKNTLGTDEGDADVKCADANKKVHVASDADMKSPKSSGKKKSEENSEEGQATDAHLKNENMKISEDEIKPVRQSGKKAEKALESESEKKEQTQKGRPRVKKDSDKDETLMEMVSSPNTPRKTKGSKDQSHSKEKHEPKNSGKWAPGSEHSKVWGEELVGCSVKVWWPDDKRFYRGVVSAYDPKEKKHTVLYADGDVEVLLLKDERWEFVADGTLSDEEADREDADAPIPDLDEVPLKKQKGNSESKQQVASGKRVSNTAKPKGDSAGSSVKSNVLPKASGGKSKGKPSSVSNKPPGTPNDVNDDVPRVGNNPSLETPKSARKSKDLFGSDSNRKSSAGKMEKNSATEKSARKSTPKSVAGKASVNGSATKGISSPSRAEEIDDSSAKGSGISRKRARATKS